MTAFRFQERRTRRWWYTALTLVAGALFAVVFVASSGAVTGSPSGFESADGNMTLQTSGNTDWNCFVGSDSFVQTLANNPPAGCAVTTGAHQITADQNGEISWVNGQKFDTACPALAVNNNPPKDEFTNIASFSETASNSDLFFYGATIRPNVNGNTSGDVELNQVGGNGTTSAGCRTAGDRLIAYDFLNGGTSLQFHVLTWITAAKPNGGGNNGTCFVKTDSDAVGCWGAQLLTPDASTFDGESNQTAIAAADNGINNTALGVNAFAEFGIDLSKALGLGGTCTAFAQQVWESRSAGSSFSSNPQDIEIGNTPISNCGTVIIRKVTSPSPDGTNTTFNYTDNIVTLPASTTSPFTLKNGDSNNFGGPGNVVKGSYTVTESDPGPTFKLTSISCTASDLSHGSTIDSTSTTTGVLTFTLQADDTIDCTYTNTLQTGALKIVKNSTKSGTAVLKAGAEFCYATSTGCSTTNVVDNGTGDGDSAIGSVCVSGLSLGTYYINETKAPPGYAASTGQANQTAVVVAGTGCGATDTKPSGTAVATFTDPPLADVQINFRDGGSGETKLDVVPMTCVAGNSTGTSSSTPVATGWDATTTLTGVQAGSTTVTVTCTAKIDP